MGTQPKSSKQRTTWTIPSPNVQGQCSAITLPSGFATLDLASFHQPLIRFRLSIVQSLFPIRQSLSISNPVHRYRRMPHRTDAAQLTKHKTLPTRFELLSSLLPLSPIPRPELSNSLPPNNAKMTRRSFTNHQESARAHMCMRV